MATADVVVDDDSRMSLMDHLKELRNRIIKVVIAVVIGMVIAFVAYDWIFDVLIAPYRDSSSETNSITNGELVVGDPLEGFAIRMKLALYGGVFIAMPVILWQLWRFITPGLYAHEKKYAIPFIVSALLLFTMGAGIAYYTLPQALNFLNSIGGDNLVTAYQPSKYFQLITYMMLAFGVGFEFPIVLIFLMMAGLLTPDTLRSVRRYAWVGITVLVAVITPSGDPFSMLMLSIPMIVFYEVAIIVGRVMARRKRRAAAATA